MKWTQTQPAADVVTYAQAAAQLRLDQTYDHDYVVDLIAAATEYAETALAASLITRTVTAVFYDGEPLYLPRGPVQSVASIDSNGVPITSFTLERHGHLDLLAIPSNAWQPPLTVVYQAGYGDASTAVPADLRLAIRQHVATLYRNRESVADKTRGLEAVPQTLADFYALKSRDRGIG